MKETSESPNGSATLNFKVTNAIEEAQEIFKWTQIAQIFRPPMLQI
jgi:hypothetical protein